MYTPGHKITYPWVVLHRGHLAFRTKDPEGSLTNVFYPRTPPIGSESEVYCGSCGQVLTSLGLVAGFWKVTYSPTQEDTNESHNEANQMFLWQDF